MWRPLFSLFEARKTQRTARRRANPHRFSGRRRSAFAAERLEARWYLSGDPIVQVNTNGYGSFQIELSPADAPQTVANFLSYVNSGSYNNLVVSRSIASFIVQAGGITSPTATYTSNSQFVPVTQIGNIPLEYKLPNTLGTIAMARQSGKANSGSDEWFINLADNSTTLGQNSNPPTNQDGFGYTVFGQVIGNGMQVVNSIAAVPTKNEGSVSTSTTSSTDLENMPLGPNNQLVQITSMTLLDGVYGTVFTDTNANGTQDSGEPGVAGRTVFVDVDGSGQPDSNNPSAVTDASGNYYIAAVPAGSYPVKEVLPSGLVSSTPLQTVTFATSTAATKISLGEAMPSISGTVFTDLHADGKLDSGDPGVSDRTVFLNVDGTGKLNNNPSTITDANGNFSFLGLAAGTYNVIEVSPSGVSVSTDTHSIVVKAGQTATADIGEVSSISGVVFNDLNVNGKLDAGEPGLGGVTVFLNNDNSGKPDSGNPSTVTDANGRFYFTGLANGSYTVMQVLVANHGVTQTTAAAAVTVASGTPPTVNIGDVLTSPLVPLPVGVNTQAPPANGNQAYVDDLYFTLLGRHAGSDGLAYWQQQMSGGATRAQVAQDIWDSTEHRQLEVQQYYHTYLNRAAEAGGLAFWVNRFINEGLTERQAAYFFAISPEYQADHSSDSDYIDSLYQDMLLRTPSASELSGWQTAMSGGQSRFQVSTEFAKGQEAATRIVDAFYYNFLHRVPDSGAQDLITGLVAGTTTAEKAGVNILASDEFFA
ncbi:MAG TPA: SdrD B-like domain-containing protein, partial [Pirellulales bacterium]